MAAPRERLVDRGLQLGELAHAVNERVASAAGLLTRRFRLFWTQNPAFQRIDIAKF